MMRSILIFATLACLLPLGFLAADSAGQQAERKSAAKKMPVGITPEREAAVKTFVERNHPELVELLELLKSSQPAEYERAIRELHRVTEKLALVQERDSLQYALELRAWQVHSRIQLLTAKLKMPDSAESDEVRRELKEAIGEQVDARADLLSHERDRVADRLRKIEKELSRLESDRQEVVDRQFQMLMKASSPKNKKPPAKKKAVVNQRSGKEKRSQANAKPDATKTETNPQSKP